MKIQDFPGYENFISVQYLEMTSDIRVDTYYVTKKAWDSERYAFGPYDHVHVEEAIAILHGPSGVLEYAFLTTFPDGRYELARQAHKGNYAYDFPIQVFTVSGDQPVYHPEEESRIEWEPWPTDPEKDE